MIIISSPQRDQPLIIAIDQNIRSVYRNIKIIEASVNTEKVNNYQSATKKTTAEKYLSYRFLDESNSASDFNITKYPSLKDRLENYVKLGIICKYTTNLLMHCYHLTPIKSLEQERNKKKRTKVDYGPPSRQSKRIRKEQPEIQSNSNEQAESSDSEEERLVIEARKKNSEYY